ncbi:MAG: PD40 domain-containing protein [Anaerolineales bacterium]|nr:PD40 domain-containing protein [Anaerolineales bacterium]
MRPIGRFLLVLILLTVLFSVPATPARAATFTVTNTYDSGPGTLRQAIIDANANGGADVINFGIITGTCHSSLVCMITLLTPLPAITGQTTLNGTTQSGTSCSAAPKIQIMAGNATVADAAALSFTSTANNSTVAGLSISGFNGTNGIGLNLDGADNMVVTCSLIGVRATDLNPAGNTVGVRLTNTAVNNRIGTNADGTNDAAERNTISGNVTGILLTGSGTANNIIAGNYLGLSSSGAQYVGNMDAIVIDNASATNTIGGITNNVEGNTIAGNTGRGITLTSTAGINNLISVNSIFGNGGLGIDLNADGVDTNDTLDPDTGPNGRQNYPLLLTGYQMGRQIIATLNTTASTGGLSVDVYANASCDGLGYGEGQFFMGRATSISTDGSGNVTIMIDALTVPAGMPFITMVARTSGGSSSEFSPCYNFTPQSYVVTTTADSGVGSLRQAITDANVQPGIDTITFNIPPADPNCVAGVCTITPVTVLPEVAKPLILNATTQPGAVCPGSSSNGDLRIVLQGTGAASVAYGLQFNDNADYSEVRGFVIGGFANASSVGLNLFGADYVKVQCNFLGINQAGATANANRVGVRVGVSSIDSDGVFIGVDGNGINDTNERNVISGNIQQGILDSSNPSSDSLVVAGNYIGTNAAGTASVGNGGNGITITNTAFVTIGTNSDGVSDLLERNVISGNTGIGLQFTSFIVTNRVMGNYIGTNAAGTAAIPNISNGILISGTNGTPILTIGTNGDGINDLVEGNVISGNGGHGFQITSLGSGSFTLAGNIIGMNATGTAALGNTIGVNLNITNMSGVIGSDAATPNPLEGNLIAGNTQDGIVHNNTATNVRVSMNRIFNNGTLVNHLGFDLGTDGPTANDAGDGDGGSNNLQNFPVISSAVLTGSTVTVSASLNSTASTTFRIELFANSSCDTSGFGEGKTYLASQNVTTDGAGNVSFSFTPEVTPGQPIYTMTAIDGNNTSEFSGCAGYANPAPLVVTTTADAGAGSLRQAMINANANVGADRITFNIAGCPGGLCTILLLSPLPPLTEAVDIDGITQTGASCPNTPRIEVQANNPPTKTGTGFEFQAGATGSRLRGLIIQGFDGATGRAVHLNGAGSTHIACNFIGTNSTGNAVTVGTTDNTIGIDLTGNATRNVIGVNGDLMEDMWERNVIGAVSPGFTFGIRFNGVPTTLLANAIRGNHIGIGANGTSAIGVETGIYILGEGNQIGTNADGISDTLERNVISNGVFGIQLGDSDTQDTLIRGNYIGTNAAGITAAGNTSGVFIPASANVTGTFIGTNGDGTNDAIEGNLISGNGTGVFIGSGTSVVVAGNLIGTDASGALALGNTAYGVNVSNSGTTARIGTNADGTSDALERNIFAANTTASLLFDSADNSVVQGNTFGVNATQTSVIASTLAIHLSVGADNNRIGTNGDNTRDAAEGNLIVAGTTAVLLDNGGVGAAPSGNSISGNTIGKVGTLGGFSNAAMIIRNGANANIIGANGDGSLGEANEGNTISGNSDDAIRVQDSASLANRISGNSIFNNGTTAAHLGIDLVGVDGVNANDGGDPDPGPNTLQNFPIVISAGDAAVSGTLNSTLSTANFRVEVYANETCDTSGNGEGQYYLGGVTGVNTDGAGNAAWMVSGITNLPSSARFITALAISAAGNTSEFSPCRALPVVIDSTDASTIFLDAAHAIAEGATIGDRFILRLPTALTGAETVTVTITSNNAARLLFVVQTHPVFTTASSRSYVFTSANWSLPRAVNLHAPNNTGDPAGAETITFNVDITASSSPNYTVGAAYTDQPVFVYDPGVIVTPSGTPTLSIPVSGMEGTYYLNLSAPPGMVLNNVVPNYPESVTIDVGSYNTTLLNITPAARTFTRANWMTQQGYLVVRLRATTVTVNHLVYSDITGPATSRYGGPIPVTISTATINTPADVRLTHAVSTRRVAVGETFTYTLTLNNGGQGNVVGLKLTSDLPEGVAFVRATSAVGGECVYEADAHRVVCDYGGRSFDRGRMETVQIDVIATAPAGMTLTAQASSTAIPLDPDRTNNTNIAAPAVTVTGATGDIYAANPNGSGRVRLTNDPTDDLHPAYSPDGSQIAYVALRHGNPEVYVMNSDGSNQRRVTMHPAADLYPTWSPDGARIVFASTRGGGGLRLYVMNADGTNVVPLGGGADAQQPVFSPDGTKIAYVAGVNGVLDVFVMNADGTGITQLTSGYGAQRPTWSPDGARIAFSGGASPELYVMTANGGNVTRLTNDAYRDESPTWAADGTLVFASDRDGKAGLYRLTFKGNGTRITKIGGTGANDVMPAAGRTHIAFARVTGR